MAKSVLSQCLLLILEMYADDGRSCSCVRVGWNGYKPLFLLLTLVKYCSVRFYLPWLVSGGVKRWCLKGI